MYRLTNIDVSVLSLVTKGVNKKKIIFKSPAPPLQPTLTKLIPIAKIDDEQHMVYGIVYSPDEVDTDGHTATAAEIKKASENFMKSGRTKAVDKQHNYKTNEGFVAENWITKKGDPLFPDDPVGSWAVRIKVEKQETWSSVSTVRYRLKKSANRAGLRMVKNSFNPHKSQNQFSNTKPFFKIWGIRLCLGFRI
jgi:hypothetical protein